MSGENSKYLLECKCSFIKIMNINYQREGTELVESSKRKNKTAFSTGQVYYITGQFRIHQIISSQIERNTSKTFHKKLVRKLSVPQLRSLLRMSCRSSLTSSPQCCKGQLWCRVSKACRIRGTGARQDRSTCFERCESTEECRRAMRQRL